ncbi:alpha-hydroxy acid oxidase [Nitratireductor sp. GCM10026969]|uniref:alpha-hydroxy acid oxidase n=1 Tax=Nitratireductor sp. GCM10026969 TaxID=3252645 RepID=UPI00361BF27B
MTPVNIDDMRKAARRRLPKIFFDYIDGGAFGEATMRANREDFARYRLEQSVLTGVDAADLSTTYLGTRHALPFMLGPVGFLGLYAGNGEMKATKAAHAAGIPLCLSTFSIASLADLHAETGADLHFQLYILKDRGLCAELLRTAEDAGVDTLHLTVDTAVTAVRERDVRNGFRSLERLTPGLLLSMARRPRWCLDMARAGTPKVGMLRERPAFGGNILQQAANLSRNIDKTLCWRDVEWLRRNWKGKLVIKGVLSAADALSARKHGADAVVVSNHGGRQLDGASSTIAALPAIREAVGPEMGVMIDGGFRRGSDIVKALALGADGVMLGRAYTYGLAASGRPGVERVIALLRDEIEITLTLMGLASVDALKRKGRAALTDAGGRLRAPVR